MATDSQTPEAFRRDQYASLVSKAQSLPVIDAAYIAWNARRQFDELENISSDSQSPAPFDLTDQHQIGLAIREAISRLQNERANAPYGRTFQRLRALFPDEDDWSIQKAISSALRLEGDATRHLADIGFEYRNARAAVDAARKDNDGFLEEAYERLHYELCFASR